MTNIGVFDSGLGGLSVLNELVKKKNANYYYLGDSLRAPYGSRPQKEIIKFSDEIVNFLEKYNIDRYIIQFQHWQQIFCKRNTKSLFILLPKQV